MAIFSQCSEEPCKIYGLHGAGANRVWGQDFLYTTGQGLFLGNIYGANTFFIHFHALFFILDTICADNKDKAE